MPNIEYEWNTFPNVGYITAKLNQQQLYPIIQEINHIAKDFAKANSASDMLAGNLKQEYHLIDCRTHVESIMMPLADAWNNHFDMQTYLNYLLDDKKITLELKELWVNFQKKGEFQPHHIHSGIYSFVIWTQIPYNLKDENAVFSERTNDCSQFGFSYINALGETKYHHLHLDKSDEGMLAIFPANMRHYVYPFYTSDDYRITVAGNLGIKQISS